MRYCGLIWIGGAYNLNLCWSFGACDTSKDYSLYWFRQWTHYTDHLIFPPIWCLLPTKFKLQYFEDTRVVGHRLIWCAPSSLPFSLSNYWKCGNFIYDLSSRTDTLHQLTKKNRHTNLEKQCVGWGDGWRNNSGICKWTPTKNQKPKHDHVRDFVCVLAFCVLANGTHVPLTVGQTSICMLSLMFYHLWHLNVLTKSFLKNIDVLL